MKILVIEDHEKLATLLKRGLEREGHIVDWVNDGEKGQERLEMYNKDYNVVILDLMLPKKTGYEVCRNLRTLNISIPILILTARSGLDDKINLLNIGADDYLVKPFEFAELLARIRALGRRPTSSLPTEFRVNDLVLRPSDKTVFLHDKEVKLSLTEFRLLEYLMSHVNEAVNREDLISNVWDFNYDAFSNIIDVYINRLRAKFKAKKNCPVISTVRGVGYKLVAQL